MERRNASIWFAWSSLASMAEASRDLAQGTIEVMVSEVVCAKERMEAREVEEAYQKFEESEEHIQELLDRGAITNDEARKLRTRAKMHQQDAEPDRPKISSAVMAGADQMTNEQMIEEALKGKRRFWLFEWMRKFFRIDRLQDRISREKRRRAHPDFVHKCPMISGMVKSGMTFELVTFFLVALNGLLTGVQISVQGTADELEIYGLFEEFFNFCFIAEIILRVIADGWTWFFTAGNASDVVLIAVTGIIPSYILGPFFDFQSPLFRIGQALRCIRLIRILKSVRTISYFRILWSLVSGIVDSGRILLWTLTIITVVLYMFSIFFVQLLLHSGLEFTPEVQSAVIDVHFSTVPDAMFTLFQCLTLDSWTSLSRPLQVGHPQIGILWVLYVAVACMVLNNLVIAVIVNNAFARAEQDEELQASIARETTEGELNDLRTLFDELAKEGSAYLSRKDYEQALGTSESLWTKLKIVNLEENEILNLWSFIDFPEEVDREYFASQIRNLKGECKAKTSFTVAMTLKKLDTRLNQARTNLEVHKRMCEELKKESREAQVELSRTLFELRQFMILTYRCIPSNATVTTKNKVQKVGEKVSTRVQPLLTPLLNYPYERVPMSIEEQKEGWALPGEVLEQKPETTLKPGTLPHASRAIRN